MSPEQLSPDWEIKLRSGQLAAHHISEADVSEHMSLLEPVAGLYVDGVGGGRFGGPDAVSVLREGIQFWVDKHHLAEDLLSEEMGKFIELKKKSERAVQAKKPFTHLLIHAALDRCRKRALKRFYKVEVTNMGIPRRLQRPHKIPSELLE